MRQYVKHQLSEVRPADGQIDIGAYELQSGAPADLAITTTSLPNGDVSTAYSATLAGTGGVAPYTWAVASGSLPTGLQLNSATGNISGTPTSAGTYNFSVQLADSQTPADTDFKELSITVNAQQAPPLSITTTSLPNARRNRAYSRTLQATGGMQPYVWSIDMGSLPPGLSLNSAIGVISGTPTIKGNWSFTVRVRDGQSLPATDPQTLSISVR